MTKAYGPFDAGAGSSMTENNWRKMAQMFAETGVLDGYLNELAVFGDSTGMHVKIPSGLAYVKGHFFESDAQETVTIAANASGNPRIDRVVLEANFTTNVIDYVVVQGTPAGSPAAPALTQNLTAKWQMPLAKVAVANGASTIAAGNVTDERTVTTATLNAVSEAVVATQESTSSGTFADLATVLSTTATITPSGKALVHLQAEMVSDNGGSTWMGVAVSGASTVAAADATAIKTSSSPSDPFNTLSGWFLLSGLTPGANIFTAKYRQDTGGSSVVAKNRRVLVIPL